MTVECMREHILKAYPYPGWQRKVARMHEPQIIAVYHSMKEHGKLAATKRKRYYDKPKEYGEQISMEQLYPEIF